jgi:hypothetical protein
MSGPTGGNYGNTGGNAFNTAFQQKDGSTPTYGSGYQTQWNRPFSYAPGVTTPQPHQYFEGTGPGGGPTPVPPGSPPPFTPPGGGVGGLPPGMGPPPTDPPINSVPPGGPYPGGPGSPPVGGPPGYTPPGSPPGVSPPGIRPGAPPKFGGGMMTNDGFKQGGQRYLGPPISDNFGGVGSPNDRMGPSIGLDGNPQAGVMSKIGGGPVSSAPPAPAPNPLLAAIYSGQGGGAFTPQELNRYGAQSSNNWNPAATSIAGSQAGFNVPAPMFQGIHLQNGDATMQNGQFTWTPQGLATMKANSGVK